MFGSQKDFVKKQFLINNKKERRLMGRTANTRIRKDFNVNEVVKNYIEILKAQKLRKEISNMVTETIQ